jgi:hypothetical protein
LPARKPQGGELTEGQQAYNGLHSAYAASANERSPYSRPPSES